MRVYSVNAVFVQKFRAYGFDFDNGITSYGLNYTAVRWIGLEIEQAQHFLLNTASLSILGYGHNLAEESVIVLWNAVPVEKSHVML